MAILANVALNDTLDTWRIRTNQIIVSLNSVDSNSTNALAISNYAAVTANVGYDKANSANLLAYNTGIGANAFTSATIAGANTAVGTGANSYAATVGSSANAYLLTVISGANTAVGTGANSYAATVGSSANTYLLTVIAGANTAVGTGANGFTSATIAGANSAVGTGANTYAATVGSSANSYLLTVIAGANTAVGTGANAYAAAIANTIAIAAYGQANTGYNKANSANYYTYLVDANVTAAFTKANAAPKITISDTAPASGNANGDQWWSSTLGKMFIYYTDVDSSQWVESTSNMLNVQVGAVGYGIPYDMANTANLNAKTARDQANIAYSQANLVFGVANTGYSQANLVFGVANTGYSQANLVFGVANGAFNKANSALANTTGTFAGDLTVSGNIVSSNATSNVTITPGSILIGGQPLSSSGTLVSMNVYTSTQTITIPAAATKALVILGGPGGACADSTSGNPGTANSTLQSGTQTITTMKADRGGGGRYDSGGTCIPAGSTPGYQGRASGGNILNIGSGINGGTSWNPGLPIGMNNTGYSAGGYGPSASPGGPAFGGSGGVCQSYLTGLTGGLTLSLTLGSGGAGTATYPSGNNGVCIIQWYT